MKINYNANAWQCPSCERWRYIKKRYVGRKLSKCVDCNITVDITTSRKLVSRIEYKLESVTFVRQGGKRRAKIS